MSQVSSFAVCPEGAAVRQRRVTVTPTASVETYRDGYLALHVHVGVGAVRTKLARAWLHVQQVAKELEAGNADEHRAPAWSIGATWNRKSRGGQAVDRSVYGVDLVAGQPLGVVQVRHYAQTPYQAKHGYRGSTCCAWFLVGRNEGTGLPFAHPINPRPIVRVLSRTTPPELPVTLARAWVFDIEPSMLPRVVRHGDVALVPVPRLPGGRREQIPGTPEGVQVIDSHVLQATEIWHVGRVLYALDPFLQHLGEQHADVRATGWHRVQVGLRTTERNFARATKD